jgi:hypothetical protein
MNATIARQQFDTTIMENGVSTLSVPRYLMQDKPRVGLSVSRELL